MLRPNFSIGSSALVALGLTSLRSLFLLLVPPRPSASVLGGMDVQTRVEEGVQGLPPQGPVPSVSPLLRSPETLHPVPPIR